MSSVCVEFFLGNLIVRRESVAFRTFLLAILVTTEATVEPSSQKMSCSEETDKTFVTKNTIKVFANANTPHEHSPAKWVLIFCSLQRTHPRVSRSYDITFFSEDAVGLEPHR